MKETADESHLRRVEQPERYLGDEIDVAPGDRRYRPWRYAVNGTGRVHERNERIGRVRYGALPRDVGRQDHTPPIHKPCVAHPRIKLQVSAVRRIDVVTKVEQRRQQGAPLVNVLGLDGGRRLEGPAGRVDHELTFQTNVEVRGVSPPGGMPILEPLAGFALGLGMRLAQRGAKDPDDIHPERVGGVERNELLPGGCDCRITHDIDG